MKMPPRLYFGTMTFAWSQTSSRVDEPIAAEMIQRFLRHNEKYGTISDSNDGSTLTHHIDTARIYAGGKTEPVVGACLRRIRAEDDDQATTAKPRSSSIALGTKAHPSQPGGLSRDGLEQQLQASLQAMGDLPSIEEFYLHQPDTEHALSESLEYAHQLVQQGTIRVVGMSNYHSSEMERAFDLCRENGWTEPTVYQGLYNPLNRNVEKELLPLLKKHNCSFVAYNPLAAGLLTGKHTSLDEVQKGRFKKNQNYLPRFYTPENFAAIQLIRAACDAHGISMVEATYRWLLCHSAMDDQDGLLLGASSLEQLDQNLESCGAAVDKGPLPDEILTAFDEGWKLTEAAGAFSYWRSYSSDMPNRESLDQGASYSAAKK